MRARLTKCKCLKQNTAGRNNGSPSSTEFGGMSIVARTGPKRRLGVVGLSSFTDDAILAAIPPVGGFPPIAAEV